MCVFHDFFGKHKEVLRKFMVPRKAFGVLRRFQKIIFRYETKIRVKANTLITWLHFTKYWFFFFQNSFQYVRASFFTRFLDHTQRRTTVGRTPLHEWSVRRRDLYTTTHNTHSRQTSMPPAGFESTLSAVERPQTYALDRAAIWDRLIK